MMRAEEITKEDDQIRLSVTLLETTQLRQKKRSLRGPIGSLPRALRAQSHRLPTARCIHVCLVRSRSAALGVSNT